MRGPYLTVSLLVVITLLGGCASLQSISVTEVPLQRDKRVFAERDNLAFLGIHFDNSFADGLRKELYEQCPQGRVTGIFTKYEVYWYVLFQRRQVSATGFCVDAPPSLAPSPLPAHGAVSSRTPRPRSVIARGERP